MALTDLQIKRAKPREKAYTLNDGMGLSLLVEPGGGKGWRFRYRFAGKAKLISLGTYATVSLGEARLKRDEARRVVSIGSDPSEMRKEEKRLQTVAIKDTFEAIAREWHGTKNSRWSERYSGIIMRDFENDIFPFIGKRPIAEIKPMELLEVLRRIEKRCALEQLRKVRQRCGEVFRYAVITGRASYNPAPDLASALTPNKTNHFPHLKADELPNFLRGLSAYSGAITKLATKFLMLTGVRTQEMRFARWQDIDLEQGVWNVQVEVMKNRKPHIVPLSRQALDVLNQLKLITGNYILVFAGRNYGNNPINKESVNYVIQTLGYKGRATGHGFRHTMSTILHEQGYSSAWIELQLAHVDKNSIRGTYNHAQYLDGRREMLQWYADYMDSLENGENVIHGTFGKRA